MEYGVENYYKIPVQNNETRFECHFDKQKLVPDITIATGSKSKLFLKSQFLFKKKKQICSRISMRVLFTQITLAKKLNFTAIFIISSQFNILRSHKITKKYNLNI